MCMSNGCCGGIIVAYDCWWVAPFVGGFGMVSKKPLNTLSLVGD